MHYQGLAVNTVLLSTCTEMLQMLTETGRVLPQYTVLCPMPQKACAYILYDNLSLLNDALDH